MFKEITKKTRTFLGRCVKFTKRKYSLHLFSPLYEENQKKLEALRDIHKGERCFVVCNGPSLKAEDLDKIYNAGDISFGCNKIDKIFSQTKWRPKYYCIIDETLQYSQLDIMQKIPADLHFYRTESYITTRKVNHPCIWLNCDGSRALLTNPKFSEDASNVIYTIATVAYAMLEIAVYMGMREIYIIGCDCSYAMELTKDGKIVNHGGSSYFAGSNDKDNKTIIAATWEMIKVFEFTKRYANAHGIKIYNATRGGKLEAFERVDFDRLF